MGYLITAHVFREKPDVAGLAGLPQSIGYRVYRHRAANVYLLDTFRQSKPPQYPFQMLLPSADIPLELPPPLEALERLHSWLVDAKLANGFKRSYVNAALLLNRLLQQPVFSFVSDDDELDFTCSVSNGVLGRVKCRCGDLVVSFANGRLQIAPLVPDADGDEEFITDTAALKSALPDAEVLPRDTPWNTELHAIAIEELQTFAGIADAILGLGSFDSPEDESEWEPVASR